MFLSRYVTHWSTIAPLRVDAAWWGATLRPLKQLEAAATAGPSTPQVAEGLGVEGLKGSTDGTCLDFPRGKGLSDHRSSLEDMEMDTKTYMESLPTNQQAYKTHHLYVLERWLNKYETLHPKGPVLGFCAGLPVYPRTCVQTLHTPDRWLREGRKVKQGETPVKIVKSRATPKEGTTEVELDLDEGSTPRSMTALFGRWQTEAWQPARAVGGIVPRVRSIMAIVPEVARQSLS
jgi:xeroderma pigmentosum group C-complementing protein